MNTSPFPVRPVLNVPLHTSIVLKILSVIIVVFGLLHLASMPVYLHEMKAADGIHVRIARFLMLQAERSIPTWFSIVLIAFNIVLLSLCAAVERTSGKGRTLPWLALAVIFSLLSMDEMLVLHERVGLALFSHLELGGALAFPWVILGALFSAATGLAFLGFLRRLPRRTARLFVLSGAIYVGAALGIEAVEALTVSAVGWGAAYYLEVLVEETLEMFGQALFAYALLDHMALSRTQFALVSSAA